MPLIKGYISIALLALVKYIETKFNKDELEEYVGYKRIQLDYLYTTESSRTSKHVMPDIVHKIEIQTIAASIGNHSITMSLESKDVEEFEKIINLDLHLGNTQIHKVDYHIELFLITQLYQQLTNSETIPFLKGNI